MTRPLTHSQLCYAALDAFVLVAIGHRILKKEEETHGSRGSDDHLRAAEHGGGRILRGASPSSGQAL